MIIVKIELHSAVTGQISEIGRMEIVNDGSGDRKRGNYSVALLRRGAVDKVLRRGVVKEHARLSYSVWVLVAKALNAVGFKIAKDTATVDVVSDAARLLDELAVAGDRRDWDECDRIEGVAEKAGA